MKQKTMDLTETMENTTKKQQTELDEEKSEPLQHGFTQRRSFIIITKDGDRLYLDRHLLCSEAVVIRNFTEMNPDLNEMMIDDFPSKTVIEWLSLFHPKSGYSNPDKSLTKESDISEIFFLAIRYESVTVLEIVKKYIMKNIRRFTVDFLMDIYNFDEMKKLKVKIITKINETKKITENDFDKISKQMLFDLYIDRMKNYYVVDTSDHC